MDRVFNLSHRNFMPCVKEPHQRTPNGLISDAVDGADREES